MKKRILSTILAVMLVTSTFAGISVSAETVTAPSVHVQEKVVFHETFEDALGSDWDINQSFTAEYEERGDGNGKAFVYKAPTEGVTDMKKGPWLRFLHNSAGERKMTLHKYMEGTDIAEVSLDFYYPEGRNFSFNIGTTGWAWQYCLDFSANGYVFFPDWETGDGGNNRTETETVEGIEETKDIQLLSKLTMTTKYPNHTIDCEPGRWHTLKFEFNNKAGVLTAYLNDKIIGRRSVASSKIPGVIQIMDQSLANAGEVMFKVDNLKIVHKSLAPITTETWKEDFETTYDGAKHWKQGWANPVVEATGDAAHGNALSLKQGEQGIGFLEKTNDLATYMNADLSVIEAEVKLPAKRRMAFDIVTTGWAHYSVIISENNEWVCFGGNIGDPNGGAGTWAYDWQTRTMKNMVDFKDSGNISKGHIAGFPFNNEGRWNTIRFVRDKVNKTLTAYIDGVSLGSVAFDAEPKSLRIVFKDDTMTAGDTAILIDNVKVGALANPKDASLALTKADGTAVGTVTAGEVYTAKMTGIENTTSQDIVMQLIVAAYDANGCMVGMECYPYTVPAYTEISNDGEALSAVTLTAPAGAATIKAFAWNGFDAIIPLCAADVK